MIDSDDYPQIRARLGRLGDLVDAHEGPHAIQRAYRKSLKSLVSPDVGTAEFAELARLLTEAAGIAGELARLTGKGEQ